MSGPPSLPSQSFVYNSQEVTNIKDFITKAMDFIGNIAENSQQENQMKQNLSSFLDQVDQKRVPNDIFNIVNELVQLISNNECKQAVYRAHQVIPQNSGNYGRILDTLKQIAEALC